MIFHTTPQVHNLVSQHPTDAVLWDFFPLKLLFFSSYILESLYESTSIQPLCESSLAFNFHTLIYWHMYKIVWNSAKHIFYCYFFAHLPFIYNEAQCGYVCATFSYRIMWFIVFATQLDLILTLEVPEFRTFLLLP